MSSRPELRSQRATRRRRRRALLAGVAVVAVVALAVGLFATFRDDGGGQRPTLAAEPGDTTGAGAAPGPSFAHAIAQANVPEVAVYDSPDAPAPSRTYAHPWHVNDDPGEPTVPLVFLVEEERADGWVRVLLPERPNGSMGWVRSSDVLLAGTDYRILVELGEHRITVYDGDDVVLQEPAAIGKPETPTPPGRYYIRVLLQTDDPSSVYGPYAYGLSAHSDVLYEFNGGDGEVGIHGNNDASVLGQSVSAGCVRMSNEGITTLTGFLPLGTPVDIVA